MAFLFWNMPTTACRLQERGRAIAEVTLLGLCSLSLGGKGFGDQSKNPHIAPVPRILPPIAAKLLDTEEMAEATLTALYCLSLAGKATETCQTTPPPPSRWAHGVKIHCEALNDRSLWPSPTRRRQWKPVSPSCERGHGGHPGHNTPKVPGRLAPGLSASGFHIILLTSYSADPSPAWFSQTLLFPNPILAPESLPS